MDDVALKIVWWGVVGYFCIVILPSIIMYYKDIKEHREWEEFLEKEEWGDEGKPTK